MAIRMPSPAAASEKWSRVTQTRQADYKEGVQGAGAAYQEGVSGAADIYAQGVQMAISEGRYASGVAGKGSKYASKASTVGPARWAQGVSGSRSDYEGGVARSFSAVASVSLPPKGAKGSPQNLARVAAVVEAQRAARGR